MVLALLVAIAIFIVWVARVSGSDRKEYDIFFKQAVSGLARGSGVAFSGVPVGEVKTIALMPDTPEFVRVRISVNEEVPILHGTTASIDRTRVVSGKSVSVRVDLGGGRIIIK